MRDSRTRSFSAVNPHMMGERARREKQRKIIITAIAVVALLIAVFTFLIFAELFGWFDKNPAGPGGDVGGIKLDYEEQLISRDDIHKGDLILINSSFPYVFPETTGKLLDLYSDRTAHGKSASGNTIYAYYTQNGPDSCAKLASEARVAFNAWADAFYKATGEIDLFVYDEDGYRSEAFQSERNANNPVKYVPAGQTEHHTGNAVDLYIYDGKVFYNLDDGEFASTYKWVYDNAHKFGFIHRYPAEKESTTGITNEKYHFRYVGVAHATYMAQHDYCLEEYLDLLRDSYAYDKAHLEFKGDDGTQYVVYYVAASADEVTEVPVPKADEAGKISYTVSGDNKEGFIVTVTIAQ